MITNSTLATGSDVITLYMAENQSGCGPAMVAPQWSYASPTPDMEARGLEPSKLRFIRQQINDDSDKTFAQNFNPLLPKLRFLPPILILIGAIICMTSMGSFNGSGSFLTGMAIFGIGGFSTVFAMWYVNSQWAQAVQICVNNMRRYVEERLNEQWQKSNGIRWSIATTQVLETHGSRNNRRIRTRTLYHIQVTAVAPAVGMVQQIPMQQGVQMVMVPAGSTVPMQMQMQQGQVQYVVAAPVQAAPPQYQQEAPPQYEEGRALTANGNHEGNVYN